MVRVTVAHVYVGLGGEKIYSGGYGVRHRTILRDDRGDAGWSFFCFRRVLGFVGLCGGTTSCHVRWVVIGGWAEWWDWLVWGTLFGIIRCVTGLTQRGDSHTGSVSGCVIESEFVLCVVGV